MKQRRVTRGSIKTQNRMKIFFRVLISAVIFSNIGFTSLFADIISLKNGRQIEGLIVSEDLNSLQLDVGSGSVTFEKKDILNIKKTGFEQSEIIRKKWQNSKLRAEAAKSEKLAQPKKVNIEQDKGHMILNVIINGKVRADLILDTGATFVVLSSKVADELGVNLAKENKEILLQVADGRKISAKLIVLKSFRCEGVQAENIEAAVMPYGVDIGDGVIGMSFLKLFNFKVDYSKNKLTLERIK